MEFISLAKQVAFSYTAPWILIFLKEREKKYLNIKKPGAICFRKCLMCSCRDLGTIQWEFRFYPVAVETTEVL